MCRIPNELWNQVFSYLTNESKAKFYCVLNLCSLKKGEIFLLHESRNLLCYENEFANVIKSLIKDPKSDVVNFQGFLKISTLHHAASYGHENIIKFLIANGAELNIKNYCGNTPLMNAIIHGHKKCVELLIANGADTNVKNMDYLSVLHVASIYGHKDILELLIEYEKNNIDYQCNRGYTALHYAAKHGREECLKLLIKNGTNVFIQTISGNMALDLAHINHHGRCAAILKNKMSNC